MNRLLQCCILILLLTGFACHRAMPLSVHPDDREGIEDQTPRETAGDPVQTAVASWYGHPYHGRRTSNGERYDMNLLTAAHRSWPFHTLVRVTHLGNGRSVLVRINDRGPFVEGREIDLSREAARRLDMIEEGTARVRLQIVRGPEAEAAPMPKEMPSEPRGLYRLQLGAFSSEKNARRLLGRLGEDAPWLELRILSDGSYYRVLSAECFDEMKGEEYRKRLLETGVESILRACE